MADTDPPDSETGPAAPDPAKPATGRASTRKRGRRRTRGDAVRRPAGSRTVLSVEDAAAWFIGDLMEVSGYVRPSMRHRSGYAHYRPLLTAPDPWYFAGLVALEACKIVDLFAQEKADALLREVLVQADAAGARHDVKVSHLVLGIMGRLGMGALLMQTRVPDILIAKVMRLLLGSPKAAMRLIPTREAHAQVFSALKLGQPVWWKMFVRRFDVRVGPVQVSRPKLIPIKAPDDAVAAE